MFRCDKSLGGPFGKKKREPCDFIFLSFGRDNGMGSDIFYLKMKEGRDHPVGAPLL